MITTTEEFVATRSTWKMACGLGISTVGMVLTLWVAFAEGRDFGTLVPVASLLTLVAFGSAVGIIRGGAILRIDQNVIWMSIWQRPVPWAAIERVSIFGTRGGSYLALHLRDVSAFPFSRGSGWTGRIGRKLGEGDLLMHTAGSNRSSRDVASAIDRLAPADVIRDFTALLD